jgi:hypothetical protein
MEVIMVTAIETGNAVATANNIGISEREDITHWLDDEVRAGRLTPSKKKFDIGSIDISKDIRIAREDWWSDYEYVRSDRF